MLLSGHVMFLLRVQGSPLKSQQPPSRHVRPGAYALVVNFFSLPAASAAKRTPPDVRFLFEPFELNRPTVAAHN